MNILLGKSDKNKMLKLCGLHKANTIYAEIKQFMQKSAQSEKVC